MEMMKDSGLKWIGVIPSDWKITRIKYMSSLKGRIGWQGLTSEEYQDDGPYLITGVDFLDGGIDWENCVHVPMKRWEEAKDIQIQNGDLLITKDGTIGKVAIVTDMPGETSLNSGVLRIMAFEGYSRRFLYWVLQSDEFWNWFNYKNAGNSTIVHLYQGDFAEFYYTFPDYQEQERIAEYLDKHCAKLDKIIADLERQIELLQKYKKSLITETVTKGLDKNVEMRDSGIPWVSQVPSKWEISKIKYCVSSMTDIDHYMPSDEDTEYAYIMIGDLKEKISLIDFDELKHISYSDFRKLSSKSKPSPDDVVFARYATIGTVCYVDINVDAVVSYGCLTITPNEKTLGRFLYYYFKSNAFAEEAQGVINRNTQGNIGKEGLGTLRIPLPSLEEQKMMISFLDSKCKKLDYVFEKKQYQLSKLRQLKASTIYEYVTGKKRVKEVV
jgi:type I restriction enzyme S subunit